MIQPLQQEQEKNKRTGMIVSAVVHAILLLLLFYIMAWRAPDPPIEEFGIELNFGMDATGSGDVETEAPSETVTESVEESSPAPEAPETPVEPQPQPTETTPVSPPEPVVTTPVESPVTVKESPKVKAEPVKEPKEEVKEQPKPKALYPGTKPDGTGTRKTGTSDKASGGSEGDDANATGNKGATEGVKKEGLYSGNPGGGGGTLNMPGWRWDVEPKPKDESNESGKIVLKVKIDADGQVENVDIVESTVSYKVANIYREEVYRKASFTRSNTAKAASEGATGFITYYIRAK